MKPNQERHSLENVLRHYPSRTVQVFNTTHLNRILRKHILETSADKYRKEFRTGDWIKSFFLLSIHQFSQVRPFVRLLKNNRIWQMICGFQKNVPTQGQYSRKIPDQRIQEVLVRTFQTYQQLIPLKHRKTLITLSSNHLDLFQQGHYPFNMDCSSLKLSPDRYSFATWGYVASEKKPLPSARIHLIQDGIHGNIVNYGPSGGHEHESAVAQDLLEETTEITAWLKDHLISDPPRPWIVFDRGYWKQSRFQELDERGWGWSIPWKKRTLIGVQQEILDFPTSDSKPLEMLIWASGTERPWKRIIGKLNPSDNNSWDILTCDSQLNPQTVLNLQKDRWEIEVLFQWIKQHTTIKQPLGTSWMHFVTHCLLVMLFHLILVYYLLHFGIIHWKRDMSRLLENLRYSDLLLGLNSSNF